MRKIPNRFSYAWPTCVMYMNVKLCILYNDLAIFEKCWVRAEVLPTLMWLMYYINRKLGQFEKKKNRARNRRTRAVIFAMVEAINI